MKLLARPASPFARKVRVMAREIGLNNKIEEIMFSSPEEMKEEMPKYNPLGKIPTLILDDQTVIYDSKVICEYLDFMHKGEKFFPIQSDVRWKTILLQALADGVAEAIIIAAMNKFMRPKEYVHEPAISYQLEKVDRGLLEINSTVDKFEQLGKIGPLSVACTIGYIDFRFPDLGWRAKNKDLDAWYSNYSNGKFMKDTEFNK